MGDEGATRGFISDCQLHFRALLSMEPGAALLVRSGPDGTFLQVERGGDGWELILDVPLTGANAHKHNALASVVAETGEQHIVREETLPDQGNIEILRIPIRGEAIDVEQRAARIAVALLTEMGVSSDEELVLRIEGQTDSSAFRQIARESLESMANSRVPILNWLARRELKKSTDSEK